MKFKNTVVRLAYILGGLALLMPIVAYAVTFSVGDSANPAGGLGSPITASFWWSWTTINFNDSDPVSATGNPQNCRLRKESSWFPDTTVFSINPEPITDPSVASGNRSATEYYVSCNVMELGNKYHWDWEKWEVRASDGASGGNTSGGRAGTYNCYKR